MLHKEITDKIIKTFYIVYNKLGYGFLEKVYLNAMIIELGRLGFHCIKQQSIRVFYDNIVVGDYFADIVVENLIILELKATEVVAEEHELQLLNYLKATDKEVGLLLNFGKKPEFKRKIFTNDIKAIGANP
ncbi:MAG: GxxExxY protein [Chitinophagaceae bacterium]|nr:GxxExxY protein [Chitinophagaceae bacterium]